MKNVSHLLEWTKRDLDHLTDFTLTKIEEEEKVNN